MARSHNILVSNSGIKLVSLALAVLLEFYFYSQDNSTTQLVSAVLEFQNVPANRMIVDPPNADEGLPAHLEVSGPKSVVRQIGQGFHVVRVPFPEKAPSTFPIDIKYESLQLPPSVKILSAKPARVTIRTVELLRKEVPVEVPTDGILPDGFELKSVKVFPKTLIVRGPLHEIQKLHSVKLDTLDLTGLGESAKFELRVKPPADLVNLNVNLVSVEVEIDEKEITREFHDIPITQESGILPALTKVSFSPAKVNVTLRGKVSSLDNIADQLKVVPASSYDKKGKKVELRVLAGDGISVQKISPHEVIVKSVE